MINEEELKTYVHSLFGKLARVKKIRKLGSGFHGLGYLITIEKNGEEKNFVFKTLHPYGFGHEYPADRASVVLRALMDYNLLPNHVKAVDAGSIQEDGSLLSFGKPKEFFILMEEVKGREYWEDLDEIRERGNLNEKDKERIKVLADYLAKIHSIECKEEHKEHLYKRVIRDFVGHGELTMGVIDTYPDNLPFVTKDELSEIVKRMVDWWNELKNKHTRLRVVHGDFYPGNIWFDGDKLVVLDRSRFRYGDPADDTTCLTMNFINYSVMSYGDFKDPFKKLFEAFFSRYFEKREDEEMFKVAPFFYAFRAIVCIHPVFYSPDWLRKHGFEEEMVERLNDSKRKIVNFTLNILQEEEFNPRKINTYLRG